jgi:geranylgeranyl pyrophosphate synthase
MSASLVNRSGTAALAEASRPAGQPGVPAALERHRHDLDQQLRLCLAGRDLPLYNMLRYHLGWTDAQGNPVSAASGKALRPALCLLACEGVGGDWRKDRKSVV